ncbi:MAG: hypothetical protein IT318_14840, partial [Anaerolineales bacterium]|nr:hypothetical protein [Anaerolineales bacterium]
AAEQAEAERLAIERAAAERLAAEQAEAERLAIERAAAERLAAEQAEAERLAIERAAAERLAAEQAEAERLAIERAAAERLAAVALPIAEPSLAAVLPSPARAGEGSTSAAPQLRDQARALPSLAKSILQQAPAPVQAAAVIGLGWAVAAGLGRLLLPPDSIRAGIVNGLLVGAASGAALGWALRRVEPAWTSKHIWLVVGGAAGATAISLALRVGLLAIVYDQELWDWEGPVVVVGAAVGGALGGYVLGVVWRSLRPAWGKGHVWRMAGAWAASLAVAAWLASSRQSIQGDVLFGAISGLLGGALSLWIAGPAPAAAGRPTAPSQPRLAAAAGQRPAPFRAPRPGAALPPAAHPSLLAAAPAGRPALARAPWLMVLLIGVGWALARWLAVFVLGGIGAYFDLSRFLDWGIGGALGGAATGLALRQLSPVRDWLPVWLAAGIAAAAWALSWLATYLLWHFVWALGLSVPEPLPSHLGLMLGSAVGGYALGGAWGGAAQQRWLLAGGWAASWLVGNAVAWQLYHERDWLWGWRWGGLAGGLLVGLVTVRVVRAFGAGEARLDALRAVQGPRAARRSLWLAMGLAALGWGAARGLGHTLFVLVTGALGLSEKLTGLVDFSSWVLGGALGGWLTALALRRAAPTFGRARAGRLAGVWAGAWAVGYMVTVAMGRFGSELSLEAYWKLPSNAGLFVGGAVGGLALAAAWQAVVAAVGRAQTFIVAGGWGIGWLLADLLRWAVIEASGWSASGWIAGWAVGGLLAGLIGAGVMLWSLTERRGGT